MCSLFRFCGSAFALVVGLVFFGGDAAVGAGIRFGVPEVLKLDWNTRSPRVADFNGDGRPDLALLNLDRSRIEFLVQGEAGAREAVPEKRSNRDRWNPVLEWSRFEKQPLVVGQPMYALAVGDWNEDGRADVAYTTDDGHLVWRFQGEKAFDWSEKREFPLDSVSSEAESMVGADFNGDGRVDLALMTESRLLVWLQGAKGVWPDPQVYALSDKSAVSLVAADLNGDQKLDLFASSGDSRTLLVRLQSVGGTFGEEWALEVPQSGSAVKAMRLAGGAAGLVWLQENTSMAQVARLEGVKEAGEAEHSAVVRHAIPPSDSRTGATGFGDLTGDGVGDVIIAEPKGARVWVFAGRVDGGYEGGKEYPAMSGVEGLEVADADGDGRVDLVLFSPGEKVIGVAQWEEGRLSYPATVYQSGSMPLAMTVGVFRGKAGVLCVEEKKPKTELVVLCWDAKSKGWVEKREELEGPSGKVSAVRLMDADQDGARDLILFSALSAAQIRLVRGEGPMVKVTGLPDSLTSKLLPGALTEGDVDGDGKAELIAAKDQLARAFVSDKEGKGRIVEQFNAPGAASRVAAALVTGKGKEARVMLVDPQAGRLHELGRGEDQVFRVMRSREMGVAAMDEARLVSTEGGLRLLCLSKDRFEVMPLTGAVLELKPHTAFDSELKDTRPTDLLAAAFGGGEVDDLVMIDATATRVLEFFRAASPEAQEWKSELYFPVFQSDPHYRGKQGYEYEPHDATVMDINADGVLDLCLLVHDRLLLYVAEK
jgi:hypothetical protein